MQWTLVVTLFTALGIFLSDLFLSIRAVILFVSLTAYFSVLVVP